MSQVKAKWLELDTDTLFDDGGNLAAKLDSSGNVGSDTSGIKIDVSDNIDINDNQGIEVADAVDSSDAVNKGQLDVVASQLNVWKEVVIDASQLQDALSPITSPPDAGIRAAQVIIIEAGTFLGAGDQLIISDGTSPAEVYEASADFDLNETVIENIATAINTNSSLVTAIATNALASISGEYQALVLVEQSIGSDIRIWQNIVNSPAGNFQYIDPTLPDNLYEGEADDMIDLPTSDPGSPATQFGFSRTHNELANNETHLTRVQDSAYTWDHDGEVWVLFGSASVPDATKALKGKVQLSDGIAVTSGIISVDLDTNEGLRMSTGSPSGYGQIGVDYDDSTIYVTQSGSPIGKLAIKPGGITNSEISSPEFVLEDETPGAPGSVALGGTFTLAAGEGINTVASGADITVSFEEASAANIGVFTINTDDFVATAGAPELDDDVLTTINTDGSPSTVTPVSHTFGLVGDAGQGVSTNVGSPAYEAAITVQDASTSQKGVAQFDSGDFSVTGGVVSLLGSVPAQFNTEGSPGVAIPAAGILNIVGGEGIDTSAAASPGDQVIIAAEDASTTNKGVFQPDDDSLKAFVSGEIDLCDCAVKTINGDSGSATGSTHAITVAGDGGQGVSTNQLTASPTNDLEITIQNASTAQKGVFQLNPDDFDAGGSPGGIVTLDTTVLNSVQTDSGTASPSSNNFNIVGGEGISTSGSGTNITISGVNATAGTGSPAPTKGVFSLEADAGSPSLNSDFAVDGNQHVTLAPNVSKSVNTDGTGAVPAASSLSIVGGAGIDTSGSSDTVTVAFEDATADDVSPVNLGAAQYNATNFDPGSPGGDVAISTDGIQDTHIDWGDAAGQVSAADWVTDSTSSPGLSSPAPANVQDGLESLEVDVDNVESRQVDQFTLSGGDITNKYITLSAEPTVATKTVLVVKDGVTQHYGDDFEITAGSPQQLSWDGLGLDGLLQTGDKVTVVYAI